MSTDIRPELSKDHKYYISKHRYYELKHFCLQYPEWKERYLYLQSKGVGSESIIRACKDEFHVNQVEFLAERMAKYALCMELLEDIAKETDPELSDFLIQAVTKGYSFTYLSTKLEIPCCKDTYYDRYRRFFWLLDKQR